VEGLPAGWRVARLGEVTSIISGSTPKSGVAAYWHGEIPWIGPADLSQIEDREIRQGARNITREGYASCATRMIPPGAVIMSSRAPIGYLAIAANELCTNQGCKSFIPSDEVDSRFLFWRLKHDMQAIVALGTGNTFTEVSGSKLKAHETGFPSLAEQRRIADRLDVAMAEVSAARALLDRQIVDCERLRFAVIEESLGGRAIASNDPDEQEGDCWISLSSVARLESGHTPSRRRSEWWGGDVAWIALPDIRRLDGCVAQETLETTNELGLANSSARLLPEGTVVLSRTASVGFVTVMGRPMATSQDFVNWVPGPTLRSWYLAYTIIGAREYLRGLSSGAIHKTIYMPTLKGLRVRLPSLEEQDRIIERIRQGLAKLADASKSVEAQFAALEALPASLLSAAFRGEL
jgi:type I restriction enzyme S subunit